MLFSAFKRAEFVMKYTEKTEGKNSQQIWIEYSQAIQMSK